jgi:VanZ family protein
VTSLHPTTHNPRRGGPGLWLPVAAYMAVIYYGAALTVTPGLAARLSDTLLHMAVYAGLSIITLRATAGGKWSGVTARSLVLALAIATLHGMSVEVEQMFVPQRFAEWRDVGNDVIGAAAGLAAAWAWGKLLKQ